MAFVMFLILHFTGVIETPVDQGIAFGFMFTDFIWVMILTNKS